MEVKLGYKQTEVGAIPLDWSDPQLSEFARDDSPICYGIVQVGPYTRSGTPVLAIKNLNCDYSTNIHRSSPEVERPYARSRIHPDDILISIKGTTGRVGIVPAGFHGNISRDLARLRLREGIDPRFGFQMLQSGLAQRRLSSAVVGTTRMELSITTLKQVRLPLPPTKIEQEAIAEALSDADSLVETLERLTAKKRYLKQATMHQLLSGQTRLPGFNGEWPSGRLGDVIENLDAGVSVNSLEDGGGASVHGGSILKTSAVANGRFAPHECKTIAPRDLPRAKLNPRKDTLLISRMNTPELVGECGYVDRDYPNLFVPDRLWMTRFLQGADTSALWLSYLLSTPTFKRRIRSAATGTSGSMKNLSKHAFLALSLDFPTAGEQQAIAIVLSDMDAEIVTLEAQREKIYAIKQGLMQQLLTGRIRLV